jgi:hypothetical protein
LVAVAVKVIVAPAQALVADALIETAGVILEVTVIVMPLDVAIAVLVQAALLVSTQVITSPLTNVALLNVAEFVPVFTPFTFH